MTGSEAALHFMAVTAPIVALTPSADPVGHDRLRRLAVHQRIFAVKIRFGDVSLDDALGRFEAIVRESGLTAALPEHQAPTASA